MNLFLYSYFLSSFIYFLCLFTLALKLRGKLRGSWFDCNFDICHLFSYSFTLYSHPLYSHSHSLHYHSHPYFHHQDYHPQSYYHYQSHLILILHLFYFLLITRISFSSSFLSSFFRISSHSLYHHPLYYHSQSHSQAYRCARGIYKKDLGPQILQRTRPPQIERRYYSSRISSISSISLR